MPDIWQMISLAALAFTICLLLFHLRQLRRYFRLTQERFHVQTQRMDGYHRRLIRLEDERKVREQLNPWSDTNA